MDHGTFRKSIDELMNHFQKSQTSRPDIETIQAWNRMVREIPDEAVVFIKNHIKSEFDSLPKNLTKAYKQAWLLFQKNNPQKMAANAFEPEKCLYCNGEGVLHASKFNRFKIKNLYAFLCGHCQNWVRDFGVASTIPRKTVEELHAQQYRVEYAQRR